MVKKFFAVLAAFTVSVCCLAASVFSAGGTLLVEESGVLTSANISTLENQLENISRENRCNVMVASVYKLDVGYKEYSEALFAAADKTVTDNDGGIMLLFEMSTRKYYIESYGFGSKVLTDRVRDELHDAFVPYLHQGEEYMAFIRFAYECGQYIEAARHGIIYITNPSLGEEETVVSLQFLMIFAFISMVAGSMGGFVAVHVMSKKMQSVKKQFTAADYIIGNPVVVKGEDKFLYKESKPVTSDSISQAISELSSRAEGNAAGAEDTWQSSGSERIDSGFDNENRL